MVKLSILFKHPADQVVFEERYNQNLALLERLPGIRRRQACMVLGNPAGKSPYYRILELYFDDYQTLDRALLSTEGRTAGADLMQYAGHETELVFAEVFEDYADAAY
jgi:uncharacterized protein (TIGR02118 family)